MLKKFAKIEIDVGYDKITKYVGLKRSEKNHGWVDFTITLRAFNFWILVLTSTILLIVFQMHTQFCLKLRFISLNYIS